PISARIEPAAGVAHVTRAATGIRVAPEVAAEIAEGVRLRLALHSGDGEGREEALEIGAVAFGAGGAVASHDEELEALRALPAAILVQRHETVSLHSRDRRAAHHINSSSVWGVPRMRGPDSVTTTFSSMLELIS